MVEKKKKTGGGGSFFLIDNILHYTVVLRVLVFLY
jgi:hypothetical protein